MKHKFLLDENILYCAIKGIDERDNEDLTAADLIRFIAQNCHSIVLDKTLLKRYCRHLKELRNIKSPIQESLDFFKQLLRNWQKVDIEHAVSAPPLGDESNYPSEDIHIVRAAHYFKALTVTYDEELRDAINAKPFPDIRALHPQEAIKYAEDT